MGESMPSATRSKTRPQLKYLLITVLAVGILSIGLLVGVAVYMTSSLAAPIVAPWFGGVPQISGIVVDAVTGQRVPGMDVCLVGRAKGLNGIAVDRSEMTHSDAGGRFSFAPSRQGGFGAAGYDLAIAEPGAQLSLSCGRTSYAYVNQQELPSNADGKRVYFPLTAVAGVPEPLNDQITYASIIEKFTDSGNIRIALIPLLQNENECAAIQDQINASFCRYLNRSYADAHPRERKRSLSNNR
jgi:hypothetical protein